MAISLSPPAAAPPANSFVPTGSPRPRRWSGRRKNLAAAAVLLVLLIAFWPAFEGGAGLMDEGMILIYPEMLLRGKLPYRDFETFYGPANPALLAVIFSAFGADIFVERTVGLLYRGLILLAIFAIVQKWGITLAVGCVFLTGCLLLGTQLPAYAWFGAMACALWSLWTASRFSSGLRCFSGGFLAGLALLFRVDVGPAMILSALPLSCGMTFQAKAKYVLGGGLAMVPLALLTVVAGMHPVLDNLFLTPVIHSSPARHLPLFSAEPYLVNLFFAHLLAVATNIAAGVAALRSPIRKEGAHLLLAVALLGLGLTHQAAQRLDSVHLLFAAFISLGVLPLSLVQLRMHFGRVTPRKSEVWVAILAVVAALLALAPELGLWIRTSFTAGFRSTSTTTFVEHAGRSFPFHSPRTAQNVAALLKNLEELSVPGERLFVGPADLRRTNYCDTYIYHMMPRLTPATYFMEMNPRSANRPNSRLVADVQSADWLVLHRAWDTWNEPNRSSEFGSPAPNEIVQRDFELRGEFGGYLLFRRKEQASPSAQGRGNRSQGWQTPG